MSVRLDLMHLRAVLHPVDAPPAGPGWNHSELEGLLPDAPLREAAVLVGLVTRDEGWQVLLTRRTDALRHHAGQVSFPGGRIEPDDADAIAAALRESREEIGLLAAQASPVGFLDPLCTITGFRVSPLVALVDPEFVPRPDPGEVAEVFEVPLEYVLDPGNLNTLDVATFLGRPIPGGRPRQVFEFVDRGNPGQRIWGATASILYNLRERISAAGSNN
ncbi:putative nudix hydrolase YeaB [Lysobacter dokdonensis DS-58]|uniref:Putative nudix hydrolase YeaB n=1 Tax=Lysobacter dokdonensis DS-58 TaxID=1300345 RepID=A0A0A2WJ16_9GAMM|nr:putative nudix hydrolase YeaB [Lysobacter dokdonensis DS-58]